MKKNLKLLASALLSLPFIAYFVKSDPKKYVQGNDFNAQVKAKEAFNPGPITTCRRTCLHDISNGNYELRDKIDFRTGQYNPYDDGTV